jgi:hypothetical protein
MPDDESRPRGRPTLYTPEIAAEILDRFAAGEYLNVICRDDRFPAASTVRGWRYDDVQGFSARYTRARALHVECKIDELLEISDDGSNDWMRRNDPDNPGYIENGESIRRSQLRSENRKWLSARLLREEYGDKSVVAHTGPNGGPIEANLTHERLSDRIARFAATAATPAVPGEPQPGGMGGTGGRQPETDPE